MSSNEIIAWSVAAAAASFMALCVFLILLLRATQSAMREVKMTVESLQGDVKKLAATVTEVTDDIRGKLQSTDPLFDAVKDVGELLSEATGAARHASRGIAHAFNLQAAAATHQADDAPTPAWLRWATIGARVAIGLRKGWQQSRTSPADGRE
ncbi:DUF948 domain-containing protein [Cohnella faecalis]|uniref:DUF948 domain-containing protein n=1 Tax=Cohnella faecalis TaxID=2315694 RepID=UPI0013145B7E|nr:DUF948 domain-containing protein [Cohnella faecalis]